MKKITSLVLAIMIFCLSVPSIAASFTDINEKHWAYPAISELVAKGTIGGYTDGSFRPDNTVTRAEFVKMVGEGTEKRANDYSDVPASHWAYKYVITSGFKADSQNNFYPDKAITRAQTIELLFRRFGKAGVAVPEFVLKEAEKNGIDKEALAWIYTYGVLVGDDGLNLRLGDTLTRAEAAALIVKSKDASVQKNFVDIVSENILKNTVESMKLFGGTYSSKSKVTNAQLAEVAAKFANNVVDVDFSKYVIDGQIDHESSKALYVMCNSDIGLSNFTVAFANANATVETAEKAIKNAAERLTSGTITTPALIYLDGNKNKGEAVTQKEIAALIVQYDTVFGSQFAYTTEIVNEKYKKINISIENDVRKYPQSYKQFAVILKGIPQEVYDYPINASKSPAALYNFARDYSDLFVIKCNDYVRAAQAVYGAKLEITFYPSLAYETGNGFAFRVKVKALNSSKVTPREMFGDWVITKADTKLAAGTEFFVEIFVDSIV